MASTDLNDLIPEVKQRAELVIAQCLAEKINLLIYCTFRSLEEQSKLYRQSRTKKQIDKKIKYYQSLGFSFLADILISVGPQEGVIGKHVTNAGPGESYHNFHRAFDSVPLIGGKAMWQINHPSWQVYGNAVVNAGLEWAGNWKKFKEYPHAQLGLGSNPLKIWNPEEMKRELNII